MADLTVRHRAAVGASPIGDVGFDLLAAFFPEPALLTDCARKIRWP
jgi:hypothetical protein